MARSKPISVKIATTKVIKALEAKLAQIKADYAKQDENEAKYQKSLEKWRKEIYLLIHCSRLWKPRHNGALQGRWTKSTNLSIR